MRRAPGSRYVLGPARRPYHCCALLRTSVEPASTATVAPSPSPSSSSPPPSLRPFFPSKTRHGYHPTADRLVARLATSAVTEVAEGTTSYAALLPHFISLFRAVLQLERSIPPNMPRGLLAAAAAIAVELSPVAVGATLVGRLPTTAAHLQSVGRLQQLSQAFAALVRQAAADSAQRPAATSLRWPRQLGEELTQASFATRAQTAHCHNPHVVGMPRGGVEATWTSVVESVAVQLFLSFRFLRATPPSTSTVAETHFVHVMLDAICSRTYTFHEVGADGKLREFRVDGVAGLLEHVLRPEHQLFAQDLGNQRGRTQRRMECVALSTLMRLFFVMLPELQQASAVGLRQRSLAGGDAASIDVDGTNDIATRRVVGVIRRRWKESAPAVQLAGAAEALPWLEMAPILLDGFRGLVEYQMKEHPHHEEEDDVAARIIAAVLPDLAACLNDFLQYDVARHMSVDGPSTDSTPTSLATTTTSSPPSGGPEGLQRNRGKRSLFYHDATATPVLRNDHVSGTDAATSTSRFTTRGTTTTADAGSSMSRGRRGGHAGVKGGELGDTLFHVFVCSDSCTAMLTAQYSLLATRRESLLEDVWLQGVCALRRTREALFSPDTPLVESPPNMAVPSGTRQPRDVKAELLDDALPALLRTAGRTTDRQKRLDQLRLLAHAQALLPTEVLECLQHILHALVQPLGAIWACPDAVRGTELRHKRAVGHVLWMGAQELILHNPAPRHAIESTWRLWLAGGVSSGKGELGRFSQVADDLVLTGMHMQQSGSEELTLATNQALRDLREGLVLGSFGCFAKQVMAARALRGIYALGNVARRGGGGPTAPGEMAAGTACYRELLGLLASDAELLLLCAYPAFLDMLYESYIRLGIPRVEILAFGDERLLPVLVPVMAAALAKSRAEDHARAHIQLCETTLFLLSQLSRFASAPDISLSRVLQTSSSDALMQVSFYCLRRAGRGGLRRMDELGWPEATLPSLPLPANITSEALLMGLVASSSSYPDTQSMNFLHVLDRSNAIMSSPRVQPLFRGQVEVVVRALLAYVESAGDRQRRHLYRAVVLSTTARESTAVRPASAMLHVDARELRVALLQRHEVERAYETHLAPSRVAGAKDFPFVADGSLSAYLLGFLIRFMEHYLRMRERVHRASMQQLSAPAKPSGKKKLTVDGTTESLTSLILLDVLSYLGQGGGWAMVCWTLNVAETATRLGRLRHGRLGDTSLESLQRSTALTAILAQLRAVPPPSPSSLLPSSFLKAVNILADVVATSPRTLLQFDRRSPLVDLLREPSRDRYRVLIFGIKQVVLYVQEASMHHQSATQTSAVDDGAASSEDVPSSSLVIPVYFREADDAVAHEAHCKARRYFLCSVLAAVDLCAEAIRSHALQHHSMDDELRHLLALSLRSLMHTLGAVVLTHLRFVTPTTMPKTAADGVVEREAELLWVALCVSSTIGAVAAMDHAGVFFCGPTLHDVQQLMTTLAALLSQATGRPAALARLPFSRRLLVAATVLSGDAHTAFRQALRLALDPRDGMDLTSVYRAIHAFGDAAGGCPSVAPLLRQLFAALAREMEEVRHNTSPPTTTKTTKGKRGRKSKAVAAEALDAGDALIVGSLPRFEAALTAVVDLHRRLSPDAGAAMTTAEVVSGVVMEKIVCEGVIAVSRQAEGDATGSSMSMEEENDAWGRSSPEDGLTDTSALALMTLSEWCVSAGDDGGASAFYLLAQQAPLFTRSAVSGGGSGPAGWSATFTDAHLRVYVANVVALLEGHKLVEVVRHAQGIFLTVEYLLERTTRLAASVMMTSEGSSTSSTSRDDAELLALLRKLWLTIATKWEEELIQSAEPTFLAAQQELLYAVRQQRSQMEPEEIEAGQDWWLSTTPAAPLATELFGELRSGVVTSLAARARGAIAAPEHVDLRAHDDLTTAVPSPIGNAHFFRAASDLLHPPKTQPAIPLALLLRLLQAFSHGSGRGEEELQRLAAAISTYAARQYVLLRPRQRGSCLNVVGLLLPEIMEDGDSMLGATGVLRAVGVPSTSAWVGPAEGIFFSDGQRAALVAQFKEAVPSIHDWSAEAWSLAYLRCGAVFLHLLSVLLRVLDHYQLGSAEMAELSIANVRREVRQRRGTTNGPADSEDASRQVELAVLREVRRRCTERQLDPVKVNTNLHESVVLQWLNATTILSAHTDALTHHAVDRAVSWSIHKAADSTSAATTCLSFLDELRSITANALEATMQVMQGYNARGWESCYARAVHLCVGRCPMEPLPLHLAEHRLSKGGAAAERYVSALRHRQAQRPELFVGSPTLLSVLTPSFYVRHFSVMVERSPSAASASVAAVVACLHFHMTQPHVPLGSVLAAVTELLASTSVRPTPVKMLCESLAMELLRRQDFRAALDPPTVASADHTTSASVPNEVLVPFLAAISREDVTITRKTLAALLHAVMRARADIFGQPPTANRQDKLSLAAAATQHNNAMDALSLDRSNPLYLSSPVTPSPMMTPPALGSSSSTETSCAPPHLDGALTAFTADPSDAAAATHRHALAGLSLSLPAAMEVAMHLAALRSPTREEFERATSMLRAADNDRRERATVYRSKVTSAIQQRIMTTEREKKQAMSAAPLFDAALHLEDPNDYGVALLHLRYALRKIVHSSFRRLARHAQAVTLADMVEMLHEVDPGFRKRAEGNHGSGGAATPPTTRRPSAAAVAPRHLPRDIMLSGTLRVLLARATLCARGIGYSPSGDPLPGGLLEPLLRPPHSEAEGRVQRSEAEAAVTIANSTSSLPYASRQRVRRALTRTIRYRIERQRQSPAGRRRPGQSGWDLATKASRRRPRPTTVK